MVRANFTASQIIVDRGQPVILAWTTENADSVTIEPTESNDVERLPPNGTVVVYPEVTTTYRLTATDAKSGAQTSAFATVVVNPT